MSTTAECEYCGVKPAPYRITEDDSQRICLCRECREDVGHCARRGQETRRP